MCVVIDGYKMFRVTDKLGIEHPLAAKGESDALSRATLRGVKDPQYCQWHECYREYAKEYCDIERAALRIDIKNMIYADIADFP